MSLNFAFQAAASVFLPQLSVEQTNGPQPITTSTQNSSPMYSLSEEKQPRVESGTTHVSSCP